MQRKSGGVSARNQFLWVSGLESLSRWFVREMSFEGSKRFQRAIEWDFSRQILDPLHSESGGQSRPRRQLELGVRLIDKAQERYYRNVNLDFALRHSQTTLNVLAEGKKYDQSVSKFVSSAK
jgi:hypothetical protein